MNSSQDPIGESGLRFFGKMSASISHEIRNALAVINENAGLINDLILMAERGRPVDLKRIDMLAKKISDQIRRANGIVENMNRFAHSVDHPFHHVNVGETLRLMAELSGRFAAMRGINLECGWDEDSAEIITSPFLMENLISLCLDYGMKNTAEGKTLSMIMEQTKKGVFIKFAGLKGLEAGFPSKREEPLLERLGAVLEVDADGTQFTLTLPERIGP